MSDWVSGFLGALVVAALSIAREIARLSKQHQHETRLEALKSELNKARDAEMAKLRADLSESGFIRRTAFERFHERRIEAICRLHAKLVELDLACRTIASPFRAGTEDELRQLKDRFDQAFFRFRRRYELSTLFLDEAVCADIATFIEKTTRVVVNVTAFSGYDVLRDLGARADKTRLLAKAGEIADRQIPPIRKAIEDQFRRLLQVDRGERENDNRDAPA